MLVSVVVAIVLFIISGLHLLWASGSAWPCSDRQSLLQAVVGHPQIRTFPSTPLTVAVALAIALAGVLALWAGGIMALPLPLWIRTIGLGVLATVFLLRGASSYTPRRVWGTPIEPFATLDTRYFAPLCLALGAGFMWLLITNMNA